MLCHFLHFQSIDNLENQNFKTEKNTWTYHFTHMYHKWQPWYMLPEIWSMIYTVFCHFGPFFALLSPNNPKNQKFGKMRKPSRDIITLNVCTINNNHIRYGSWDMDPVTGRFFCHFGLFFALLSPLHPHNPPPPKKQKLWKNEKTSWRYYHFTHVCHK